MAIWLPGPSAFTPSAPTSSRLPWHESLSSVATTR